MMQTLVMQLEWDVKLRRISKCILVSLNLLNHCNFTFNLVPTIFVGMNILIFYPLKLLSLPPLFLLFFVDATKNETNPKLADAVHEVKTSLVKQKNAKC